MDYWGRVLREQAAACARAGLSGIKREFPAGFYHHMKAPGDAPYRPRARTPAFYGCYDWHSAVETHWMLVRLLRTVPGEVPGPDIAAAVRPHFERVALAAEEDFITSADGLSERPYGWGWALALVHETASWDDPAGRKWADALAPLGEKVTELFLAWLGQAAYPVRYGLHGNSAFGLSRAFDYAQARAADGEPELARAIAAAAHAWYGSDMMYPAAWEPSGHDFLSPALTEAELMSRLLPPAEFADWLGMFLPGIEAGTPAALFAPAAVPPDGSDGQEAHRYGLNATRAWCWRRLAAALPAGDPRAARAQAAARAHAEAVLPHVTGADYMLEHWLPALAVLMLS